MLNNRTVEILRTICINLKALQLDELVNKYNLSKRMIRYDLDKINDFLKENKFDEQITVKKSEVFFTITKEEQIRLEKLVNSLFGEGYVLSQDERAKIIIFRLIHPEQRGIITYDTLCEELKISRSTLVGDMKNVRNILEYWNLEMVSVAKKGFICLGREKAIRNCMIHLLVKENIYTIDKLIENYKTLPSLEMQLYEFSKEEICWLKDYTAQIQRELGIVMADMALVRFIEVVLVSMRRIAKDKIVEPIQSFRQSFKERKEYAICIKLCECLTQKYSIEIPENEVIYIMSYLMSASKTYLQDNEQQDDYLQVDLIANKMIAKFNRISQRRISFHSDIRESFMHHVNSMIFRMEFDVVVVNPMLEEIKRKYPQLFLDIISACNFLENYFGAKLSENEIGYLVLYFQLVLDGENENEKRLNEVKKSVLIVCSAGFVTGKILAANLQNHFDFNLIAVTSHHHIHDILNENQIDIIISTIPIKEDYQIPIYVVSPNLDINELNSLRQVFPLGKRLSNKKLVNEIMSVVEENVESVQLQKIKNILKGYFHIENENTYEGLANLLEPQDIRLDLKVSNWKEAMRMAAASLVDRGCITHSYIERMIETVHKLGAYIVVTDEIAIPHANPGVDVLKFGITITTFMEPLTIMDKSGVKVFITFAIKDKDNYKDMVMEIMELIEDETFLNMLEDEKDGLVIYEYIVSGRWKT